MKVFILGATGYLGTAIGARLAKAGLEVHGLARNRERAELLQAIGVTPTLGTLERPESFLSDLKNSDAVVQAARWSDDVARNDQRALELIRAGALDGRVRHVIYTSGAFVHGDTGDAVQDESSPLHPAAAFAWRPAHEEVALDLIEQEVHVSVMRPGRVYGGCGGIFGSWFREARVKKTITYPGEGSQHWNPVHREDVAEAYRLALEHVRGGQRFILVDESHHTVRELAEAAARVSQATPRSMPRDQVLEELGEYGAALLTDRRLTAAKARRELGWVPRHTSFVNEVEALHREWMEDRQATVA
jgi:nucleoside-diphosphate-sugar epimerase